MCSLRVYVYSVIIIVIVALWNEWNFKKKWIKIRCYWKTRSRLVRNQKKKTKPERSLDFSQRWRKIWGILILMTSTVKLDFISLNRPFSSSKNPTFKTRLRALSLASRQKDNSEIALAIFCLWSLCWELTNCLIFLGEISYFVCYSWNLEGKMNLYLFCELCILLKN